MDHSDHTDQGTIREKSARLNYDPEVNGGTLKVQGDDWAESITNKSVIAVIDHASQGEGAGNSAQQILLMSNASEPTLGSSGSGADYRFEDVQASNLPQSFIDANSISSRITRLSQSRSEPSAHVLYVIISTLSGTGEAQQYFDSVVKPVLTACGIHESAYSVHTTYSDKSISNFASAVLLLRANEGIPQTVMLLSGDGGIVDVVNTVLSSQRSDQYTKPAIGLLTLGTGNAFANSTGLNKDLTRGLRHFFQGEPHRIPTFTAKFSPGSVLLIDEGRSTETLPLSDGETSVVYGAVVCSWALHASLVADSDTAEYRKYGTERFQMAANELLMPSDGSPPHAYKGKITVFKSDDQGQEARQVLDSKEHMYILATLVSNLEETLTISPHSKPLDGQIHLLHFGPIASDEVMKILGLAFQGGKHIHEETVGYESIEGMRIDFSESDGRWRRVCVDGKIIRVAEGGWVEMRKNTNEDVLDIIADLR